MSGSCEQQMEAELCELQICVNGKQLEDQRVHSVGRSSLKGSGVRGTGVTQQGPGRIHLTHQEL